MGEDQAPSVGGGRGCHRLELRGELPGCTIELAVRVGAEIETLLGVTTPVSGRISAREHRLQSRYLDDCRIG